MFYYPRNTPTFKPIITRRLSYLHTLSPTFSNNSAQNKVFQTAWQQALLEFSLLYEGWFLF